MGTLLGACSQEMAIHIENSRPLEGMWRILAGIANSADTEIGHDLYFGEFIDIKAIPGEPLSNFFGKLPETAESHHTTATAKEPRRHRRRDPPAHNTKHNRNA